MRNWTPEARKAQSEAIRRWQPWKNSTGPKTQGGKNICRLNALRGTNYNDNMIELRKTLDRQARFLRTLRQVMRLRAGEFFKGQTIMMKAIAAEGHAIIDALDHCLEQRRIEKSTQAHPESMGWYDQAA